MDREEASKLKAGDFVRPHIGKYHGNTCKVIKTEMDAGSYTGWIHVTDIESGTNLLFTGQEVLKVEC